MSMTAVSAAFSQEIPRVSALPADELLPPRQLQLEVFINGSSTRFVATFYQAPNEGLSIDPEELRNVGLVPDKEAFKSDGTVVVSKLPGVAFVYDEADQSILFTVEDHARAARRVDASRKTVVLENENDSENDEQAGLVTNYSIYGTTDRSTYDRTYDSVTISGAFEERLFSDFGTFSTSHVMSSSVNGTYRLNRLDTSWSYSDARRMIDYRVGDFVSGGLSWTRPYRLGGVQIARNFSLRPDLVTMPLPQMSGSAAVPSTVDVFVDSTQALSQDIDSGPFQITNLPILSGPGKAKIVVRDVLGRETVTEASFYGSSDLLAPGLWDLSGEAGYARLSYGRLSNDYADEPVASASARMGITPSLTLEAHSELGAGLLNGGLGGVVQLGAVGVAQIAAAVSQVDDKRGAQVTAGIEADIFGYAVYAQSQRTIGAYEDIASITDNRRGSDSRSSRGRAQSRAMDQIGVSVPIQDGGKSLNLSFTRLSDTAGFETAIVNATYNHAIGERGNLFITAYSDLKRSQAVGLYAGLSLTFGDGYFASSGVTADRNDFTIATDISKPEAPEEGGWGLRLRDIEGSESRRGVSASYRASVGRIEGSLDQSAHTTRGSIQLDGSAVVSGGGLFFSNRVDDAFAIVDTGTPDVDVLVDNRKVARTDNRGRALVTALRAHERTTISIDPDSLPLDADLGSSRELVLPSKSGAVAVNFSVDRQKTSTLIIIKDEQGHQIPPGSKVVTAHETTVVGYDGQMYLSQFEEGGLLTVTFASGKRCSAPIRPASGSAQEAVLQAVCKEEP